MTEIKRNRLFMQCPKFKEVMQESDQIKGLTPPAHNRDLAGELIQLPSFEGVLKHQLYADLLDIRRSERAYTEEPMSQEQLAFMLWSAQGVQKFRDEKRVATLRPVPSGGSRHPFELYAIVQNITGLKPGLYRYLPLEHVGAKQVAIEYLGPFADHESRMTEMLAGQKWAAKAPVVLFVSCIPYRAEWRYVAASHRVMLIDLGHIGQNMMLSASALGLGSCCMAAYHQELCDEALGFDGIDEYTVYAVSVGAFK